MLFVCGVSFAQSSYREYIITRSLESRQYDIRLPFTWENGKLVVPVVIGEDSLCFLFDTGAICVIKSSLAEQYDLKEFKQGSLTDANNAKGKSSLVHIPRMKADGVLIEEAPTAVLDDDNILFSCMGVDGILGSNVLIGSCVSIDYQDKEIRIKPSAGDTLAESMLTNSQNIPYFQLPFGEKKAWFLFDSGANAFGDISSKTRKRLKKQLVKIHEAYGISGFSALGHDKPDKIVYYKPKVMKTATGAALDGVFATDHENRLGTKMLQQGRLTLDFETKSWHFERYEHAASEFTKLNIVPLRIGGDLVVGKKSASLRDISIGDPVIEISDLDLSTFSNCTLIQGKAMELLNGKTMTVKTKKGKQTVYIEALF
jgi:hypothetical protein